MRKEMVLACKEAHAWRGCRLCPPPTKKKKISSEFQNEAICVKRYVKEASKEMALIYRLYAISLIKPASRVYHTPT